MPVSKAIFTSYTGISPAIAESLCFENKLDSSMPANVLAHGEPESYLDEFLSVN